MIRRKSRHILKVTTIGAALAFLLIAAVVAIFPQDVHQKLSNTIGIALDIFGVIYVAYDLFPFEGIREITKADMTDEETVEYVAFKHHHVRLGLIAITTGFFCQIFGYWAAEIESLLGLVHA